MNNFNSEGQTSKLTQQQYFAPQPQIMTTQQINDQVDQIINPYSTKHPSKLYRKPPYKFQPNPYVSVNKLFSIGTIMGIIGSILCFLCVFLPNRTTYIYHIKDIPMPEDYIEDASYHNQNLLQIYHSWLGWTILVIAIIILISCIFMKYEFGITRFIGLCVICYFNYYSGTPVTHPKSYFRDMAYGYYLMYAGVGILLISAILMLIANIKEQRMKKQVKSITYRN